MADEVIAPGRGRMPRKDVYRVENNQRVDFSARGRARILDHTGRIVRDIQYDEPTQLQDDGWVVTTFWNADPAETITYQESTWAVPPPPSTWNNQLVYLFNALQTQAWTGIFQPVLQYGVSPAGGGAYWAIGSWYVTAGPVFYSPLQLVSPGDALVGIMTNTYAGLTYNWNCKFAGYTVPTLNITNIPKLTWVSNTLESYGVTALTDYPSIFYTQFSGCEVRTTGDVYPVTPFYVQTWDTDFGQHGTILSNANPGAVHRIYYQEGPSPSPSVSRSPSASPSPGPPPTPGWVTIHEETFHTIKSSSGMVQPHHMYAVPHSSDPRDPDYPDLAESEAIKVIASGSHHVLTCDESGGEDFAVAGWFTDQIGTVSGDGNHPKWLDCNRRVRFIADYNLTSASWAQNVYSLPIRVMVAKDDVIDTAMSLSGGDNQLILHAYCWGSSNINLFSYIMTAAAWIGKRVRFQLDYTPGTMSGSSVANDGSLIFSLIDLATSVETVVYNVTGRDLYLSQGGDSFGPPTGHVPADNHISGYALGLYGLTGDCERFLIQAFEEVVTSPSPEPPEPEPTTLPDPVIVASEDSDCATSTSDTTKENTPGPIEPVVDPVWYPMCIGQGTVATAPDLIDPESWVS